MDERFRELLERVKRNGIAVGIGHPYQVTIEYLQEALPRLEAQGIKLTYVSEVLGRENKYTIAQRERESLSREQGEDMAVAARLDERINGECVAMRTVAHNESRPASIASDGS